MDAHTVSIYHVTTPSHPSQRFPQVRAASAAGSQWDTMTVTHFVALNFKFRRLDPAMPPNRCGNEKRENAYPKYVGVMCWWLRFHATSPSTATVYTSISCAIWTMENDQKSREDQELLAYKWAPLILLPLVGYLYH
jgi:hypothetical protein